MKLSETDKAYIAGVLDSDGCITMSKAIDKRRLNSKGTFTLRLVITMTYDSVIDWIIERIGGFKEVQNYTYKPSQSRHLYTLRLSGKRAAELCKQVLPYMIAKRNRAEVAIEFAETIHVNNNRGRDGIFQAMPNDLYEWKKSLFIRLKKLNSVRGQSSGASELHSKFSKHLTAR